MSRFKCISNFCVFVTNDRTPTVLTALAKYFLNLSCDQLRFVLKLICFFLKNNATCRSTAGFAPYICQCQAPYTGEFCDTLTSKIFFKPYRLGTNRLFYYKKNRHWRCRQDWLKRAQLSVPAQPDTWYHQNPAEFN